jgi:hypothetical protein
MTEQKNEGELKRQTRMIVPKIKKLYGYPPVQPFYQREVEKVLDEAKADFEKAFNEKEDLWLQFLNAQSGESGDYPDLTDFTLWLAEETKKLLACKKKWFGAP